MVFLSIESLALYSALFTLFVLDTHQQIHKTNRQKKADLIKKFLKIHKNKEGTIKLMDGRYQHEGNVEIFHLGRWGSVCDDEWDIREANVVCRQLGYERAIKPTHSSHFGLARRKYWMDNLYCTGEEKSLDRCRFDGWGESDCAESEAAGVVCYSPEDAAIAPTAPSVKHKPVLRKIQEIYAGQLELRLMGGRVSTEGRVEIRLGNSSWGVICGDGWGLPEGMVVCRQLRLGYASDAMQTDYFGGDRDRIVLSGVQCRSNEATLDHCVHARAWDVQCPGDRENIATVVCATEMADLVLDHREIEKSAHLQDRPLYLLQCAMEENCVASAAYRLREEHHDWQRETRRLLRFTARITNAGTADFRSFIPKHLWEFHQCHMHYHSMEVFATFDVLNSAGVKVAEGHKASFCLEDNECADGVRPRYACANYGDQGISVNCTDIYRYYIDCQWVDISELEPGLYTFKVAVNPEFKVPEMSYDNNAVVCTMYYAETFVRIYDCTIQRP